MPAEGVLALILSAAALVGAIAAWLKARADGQLAKLKSDAMERERNAEIMVARTTMESEARKRADEVENRLFSRFEQEAKLNTEKINNLDTLYRDTRHELDTAKIELKKAEERSALNREDLEAAKIRINTLERSLREVTKSWQAAEDRVKELEKINGQLKEERDLLNTQIKEMGEDLLALGKSESELRSKVHILEQEFGRLRTAQALGVTEIVEEILDKVEGLKESNEVSDSE